MPPQAAHGHVEEPVGADGEMSAQQLMEELAVAADRQAEWSLS